MLLSLRATGGPLYRRVYLALKAKIRAGGLGPAARVPSTRALARDLGVSRNTVMLAYEQLAAEGYLVSRHRGGVIVAVSHADPIKAVIAHAMGIHLDLFQRIVISPCSISAVLYSPTGAVVLTVNSTGDDLTSLAPS